MNSKTYTKWGFAIADGQSRTAINLILQCIVAALLIFAMAITCKADENIYKSTVQSTVWVIAGDATGSGILIDKENKLVVTNDHVVGDDKNVTVFFPVKVNGRRVAEKKYYTKNIKKVGIAGKVIATNPQRDVAVIQLEKIPQGVQAVKVGKPAEPGAQIHSVGNPGDSDALWVYTSGIVRANYYRTFSTEKRHRMQVVESDLAFNPGDSGGPIVNKNGELVGLVQSFSREGRLMSHGVDISEVSWFLNKVKTENKMTNNKKSTSNSNSNNSQVAASSRKVKVGDNSDQTVFVSSEFDVYRNAKNRRVWSLAKSFDKTIPNGVAMIMLEQNSQTQMGGWVLEKGKDGKTHMIFMARVSENASDDELESIVDYVGKVTANMKKEIGN